MYKTFETCSFGKQITNSIGHFFLHRYSYLECINVVLCLTERHDNSPVTVGRNSYASAKEVQIKHNMG